MIKFIHLSDSHLGFSDHDLTDEDGKNIREEDVYASFANCVDIIIDEKPDFVLHTGDLFHRASPSNRTLIAALRQIDRIVSAGIKFYLIAGNHDFPKSVFTPAIHELYKLNGDIVIANNEEFEIVETDEYILHMLPHINSEAAFTEQLKRIKITNSQKPNILATHLSVGTFLMDEFGERVFPPENISILKEYNYVALGHWHKFQRIKECGNAYYAGATERTSESQTGYDMGVVRVIMDGKTRAELIPLKLRTYKVLQVEDCSNKETEQVYGEISDQLKGIDTAGGIFRVNLIGLSIGQAYEFTRDKFSEIFAGALTYRITKRIAESEEVITIDGDKSDLKTGLLEEMRVNIKGEEFGKMKNYFEQLWNETEEEEANANS